jgi:hypothetical protein
MRTYLLIIALATLAAAQATQPGIATQIINLPDTIKTTIDDISYSFVKQRMNTEPIAVPLPAAAYKDYGNIKLIVIAIPYSPEEDPHQAIKEAIKELTKFGGNFNQRVSNAIEKLLSIRSVFYPYETFRVRLIFIIFVRTQTLIDYTIKASQELFSGTADQSPDPNAAAALYTNTIMEILYARYQNWQNSELRQLVDEINGFTLQYQTSGDTIHFTGYAKRGPVLSFSVTVKLQVKEKTEGNTTTIMCNLSSVVDNISEGFTHQLADHILNTLPTLTQDDISRIFAGIDVTKDPVNNRVQGLIYTISGYYSTTVTPVRLSYQGSIENTIRSAFTKTEIISCNSQSCNCENLKNQFINSLLQKTNNVQNQLRENYRNMLYVIDKQIYGNLSVVNKIKSSLLPSCSGSSCSDVVKTISDTGAEIASKVASVATSCLTNYLSSVAHTGVNSIVSTIPGVNVAYMVANGIFGALQNVITIEGTIVTRPAELKGFQLAGGLKAFKVYNVSSAVACYSSDIKDVSGEKFVSSPSPDEAAFAMIKGALSAMTRLFLPPTFGQIFDFAPIVREVDIPQDGYFMFGSTPGIYVLEITNLNAKNIVDEFKNKMKNSIINSLKQSYSIGFSSRLYFLININIGYLLSSSDIGNIAGLYSKAYNKISVGNYDFDSKVNDNTFLTLRLYFIVIPPYMVGERLGSSYVKYTPSADIFGLMRSFFFPTIGNIRQGMIQALLQPQSTGADLCSQSGQPASTSTSVKNFVSASCSNAVDTLTEEILKPIVNKVLNEIINNINNVGTGSQGQTSQDLCSVEGLLAFAAENAIDIFKSSLKDQIRNFVSNNIVTPLSNTIKTSICAPLGDAVNRLAGEKLSSLIGDLLGAYGASFLQAQTTDITGGVCRLIGGSQTIRYLGLYATRLFDAAEEGLYVPSYFLSAYPIKFKESPTARWCYKVVISPYYIHTQPLVGLLMQGARMIEVPVLVGVNKYFDTFKVYPAMAVREIGNPNPYYFVVPYSTPARELFVLGTVRDVVVYDGGSRGSGGVKPFLYYDLVYYDVSR